MPVLALTAELDAGRELLGGKAFSIATMRGQGIPVPPAFVLTTDECPRYYDAGRTLPPDIEQQLPAAVAQLERETGCTFAAGDRPLLVSVRSGAPTSMPGMMDTILNLGLNDEVQAALAQATGNSDYAADTRRRFEEQYAKVVGAPAPAKPWDQLTTAIAAVFDSWRSPRAIAYRKERGIPDTGGTAVTVQAMVFGNFDQRSGTGVLFSRDPTGATDEPYGEWLPMGQGEDVVSGAFDPLPLDAMAQSLPDAHAQLLDAARTLDELNQSAMDIEFTVQSGKLWLLQSRKAKVATQAGPHVEPAARSQAKVLAEGKTANPGIVTGVIVTDVDDAELRALDGEDVILARPTTDPHDVRAMAVARAILTEIGGATSHAAVVSRELGVPCIVGCGAGALTPLDGQEVTVDASAGVVLAGRLPVLS